MTRNRLVDGVLVPLTVAEDAALDTEEATWNAGAKARAREVMRLQRDTLLRESDWTRLDDAAISAEKKAEWATYRQVVRDLPKNTADPETPAWPISPFSLG